MVSNLLGIKHMSRNIYPFLFKELLRKLLIAKLKSTEATDMLIAIYF